MMITSGSFSRDLTVTDTLCFSFSRQFPALVVQKRVRSGRTTDKHTDGQTTIDFGERRLKGKKHSMVNKVFPILSRCFQVLYSVAKLEDPPQIEDPWFCGQEKGTERSARGQALPGGPGGPARTDLRSISLMNGYRTQGPSPAPSHLR